ncbi:MAG: dickkopf-related protein [Nannocystales bacterium]
MKHRRSRTSWILGVALLGLALGSPDAAASPCDEPGSGWLMCEDFEGGGAGWADWYSQSEWTECDGCPDGINDPNRIRLEDDPALAHDGSFSVTMPGSGDSFRGGTLRFATCADGEQNAGCTLEGHDRLYLQTWVRLDQDHNYVHHFLGLGGSRPDAYWDANGNAGCRPNGERWAGTRVDLNPDHELFFYTYYPGMNCDAGGYCSGDYAQGICDGCADRDMPCTNGLECCWGNHFSPETPVVLQTETWTCLEMMMELNTPGQEDGSMAFWVDDVLGHEADGLAWRDVPELQLNRAMLEHYIAAGDTDHANQVWFDDVVVSTERIGCSVTPGGGDTSGGSSTSGGGEDDSGGDDGPTPTTGAPSGGDGPAPSGDTGGGDEGPSGSSGQSMPPDAAGDDSASGCQIPRGGPSPWMLGMFVLGLWRRRR